MWYYAFMSEQLTAIKELSAPVLRAHNAVEAYVFGSTARGDNRSDSDIDILARFDRGGDLFEFVGVKLDLEDVLGKKVDLVEMGALRPEFRPYVDQDKVRII